MKLYVARHGETAWNAENRVCGSTELPLTDAGLAQAQLLAEKVKGRGITRIVSSPMLRAMQTAQPSAALLGLPIEPEERFREQDYGIYEGAPRNDPGFLANKRLFCTRYPKGESMMDLAARVYAALYALKQRYPEETVLVVCHGAVCRTIRSFFVDMTNEEYFCYSPENASLAEYDL
ncbi:MAG: histidine phosphatase family protein [Oscillospiraceae bacterium]|nr:histidine phosphatase family protein [Oscillospiraceae bacterium]MBR2890703.1 histidine phosphatase family protein [Oscillospiraceae bacterium]